MTDRPTDRPQDGPPAAHPSTDELADLSAGVLDSAAAHRVADHVAGCIDCTGLLHEADSVRTLLREQPVEPMPDDVWARLEAALVDEASTTSGPGAAVGEPRTLSLAGATTSPVQRLRRPASRSGRTRRQARSEARDQRLSRLPRLLGAAAAAIVLVGGLGYGVSQLSLSGSDDSAGSATADVSGGSAEAGSDAGAPEALVADETIRAASGTNYTSAEVAAQVTALLSEGAVPDGGVPLSGGADDGATSAPTPATADPSFTAGRLAPSPEQLQAQPLLGDPAALEACLAALYSDDLVPLAVDIATFEGRDAAIIVLPARDGGYEVWAVSRTCTREDDGTLFFTTVPRG